MSVHAWLARAFAAILLAMLPASIDQAAERRPLTKWYTNYATIAQGASITSPSQLHGGFELEGIIGGKDFPQGRLSLGCVFADNLRQREEFTIDLGQTRKLGFIVFECELPKRVATSLTIQISNAGAQGPWKTVFTTDRVLLYHTVGLDNEVPARWIHVDLGEKTNGRGSHVARLKVFPRYHLEPASQVVQELIPHLRRDLPDLAAFWRAAGRKRWNDACDELIKRYAARGAAMRAASRTPEARAPDRVQVWMADRVVDNGITYQFTSSDWNWLARAPGAPTPALGYFPGAYSIFNDFANAYLATGEDKYARKAAELLTDWLQDNPYPGWHFDEDNNMIPAWGGLTMGGRCSVFSKMIDTFFAEKKRFTRDLKMNLINSIWQHLDMLDATRTELGGNWLTNVNSGLFGGAVDYPEFVEQKKWLTDSLESFEVSLSRDVFPCGREVEDSTQYVPIASSQMLGQYAQVRKAGLKLSPEAERRMSVLWDAIAWMTYPDGSGPAVGDCFRLSPLRKDQDPAPKEFLELFDRPDLRYMNSRGTEGSPPSQTSRDFAGWYVLRSPWEGRPYEDARHLFFKCSENRTHCHRDQLQVLLYAYGREILTDPAMVGYGLPENRYYSGTAYHNTICVNETDQEDNSGTEHAWAPGKGADFVDAEFHYGTVIGRRQVLFLKSGGALPDYWLVRDRISGRQTEHTIDVSFHLSEGAAPTTTGKLTRTNWADGGNLLILGAADSPEPTLTDYTISDRLRGPVPAKCVRFRVRSVPAVRFDTFLVPYKGTAAPSLTATELAPDAQDGGKTVSAFTVRTEAGTDALLINAEPGRKLAFAGGRLVSDAQALVLRYSKDGKLAYAFQYGGTGTSYDGKTAITVQQGSAFAETSPGTP